MKKLFAFPAILCAVVLVLLFMATGGANPVQADSQTAEKLDLTCQYPVLSSYAGTSYSFDVSITYTGPASKVFDLSATVPDGFSASIMPGYGGEGKEIAAIRLDGTKGYGDSVKLTMTPYAWKVPAAGSYPVTLTVSAGDLKSSISLTAIVTANYDIKIATPDGRLNTEAKMGQDSHFAVVVTNSGSADLEKVTVSCPATSRPSGWTVTVNPDKIDLLKPGDSKTVDVTLRPSDKSIAGDYMVTIQAEPEARNAFTNIQIRVTALTADVFGWIGIGIVVLVMIALAAMFLRFGRR